MLTLSLLFFSPFLKAFWHSRSVFSVDFFFLFHLELFCFFNYFPKEFKKHTLFSFADVFQFTYLKFLSFYFSKFWVFRSQNVPFPFEKVGQSPTFSRFLNAIVVHALFIVFFRFLKFFYFSQFPIKQRVLN